MLSPNSSSLSSCLESATDVEKTTMKRIFSKTDDDFIYDDVDYKRQKVEKHSVEDINNATITAFNGYMTRNRLKKQLNNDSGSENNENKESSCKPVKAKRNRQRKRTRRVSTSKKRILSGYVFSQDICATNLDKNLVIHTKYAPSLFDSDSETEINNHKIQTSVTSQIIEEKNNPETEFIQSTFNKSQVKTYFNKKSYLLNNKSNATNGILSNLEESNNEDKIFVTESLIKQLKNELGIKNTSTEDKSLSHKLPSESNTVKSNALNIKKKRDNEMHNSKVLSAVNESNLKNLELSSETPTVKSVVLNIEEEKSNEVHNFELPSAVYENKSKSNELSSVTNTDKSVVLNIEEEKGIKVLRSEMLSAGYESPTANNFFSIFDLSENEAQFMKSTVSDSVSKTSNVISKEINETNNFVTNKLNKSNLVNEENVCIVDDTTDEVSYGKKQSSSYNDDSLLEQDTYIYDLFTPNSPNIIIENTSSRVFDLTKEKSNINENENFTCNKAETFTNVSEEVNVLSNYETYCNDTLLGNSKDINTPVKSGKSPLKNIGIPKNSIMSIFDLPDEKTAVHSFVGTEHNINENYNLYSDSKISTNISKKMSETNNVQICSIENNISDKLVKNHSICSPTKLKNKKDGLTLQNKMSPNLITEQCVPTLSNHDKKRKSDSSISELKNYGLIKNDNVQFEINNSMKKIKNLHHESMCLCKVFYNFNEDANQILTSKVKHLAFNTIAKTAYQQFHFQKNFEANLLKRLINSDKIFLESKQCVLKPTPDNLKTKKSIEQNNYIEPKISNILKDAYGDVDYLPECDYKIDDITLPIQQNVSKSDEHNIQSTKKNLKNNSHLITNSNENISSNISNNFQEKTNVNFVKEKNDELLCNYQKHNTNAESNVKNPSTSKVNKLMIIKDEEIDESHYNYQKYYTNAESNVKNPNTSKVDITIIKDEEIEPYCEIKQLPYCLPEEPIVSTIENNIFNKKCEKSLINVKNDPNEYKNILSDKIETQSIFSTINNLQAQYVKDKIEDMSDSMSDNFESSCKSLFNLSYYDMKNSHDYKDDVKYVTECEKSLTSVKNNQIESKSILSDEIQTKSVFSPVEKFLVVEEKLEYVSDPDFELKPLPNCQPNKPNALTVENHKLNSFNKECEKSSMSIKNDHNEFKNISSVKIETKSLFSPMEDVQFVNDEVEHASDSILTHNFESSSKSLFDHSNYVMENSYDCSSDDDNKLQINIEGDVVCVDKNLTTAHSLFDKSKNSITTNSTATIELIDDVKLVKPKRNESTVVISNNQDHTVLKSDSLKKEKRLLFINQHHNVSDSAKEEKKSLDDCFFMTVEMCNNYYEKRSFNKDAPNNKYEHFSNNLKTIFKEMYVDDIFVSLCQHIIDLCDDNQLKTNNVLFSKDKTNLNREPEKMVSDVKTKNELEQNCSTNIKEISLETKIMNCKPNKSDTKVQKSDFLQKIELEQSCSTSLEKNEEMTFETETVNHKPKKTITNVKYSNSPKKKGAKSNMKVRLLLRGMITSNNPLNSILESKEFRSLRFFNEEEIAQSIGVFLFEQTVDSPVIIGLSVYKESYDHLNDEDKCRFLKSAELKITCPKITKLTLFTLALAKMLRSDLFIELVLNVIKKNICNKKMNTDHSIDHQLMKFTAYFVDICIRLRLLKTLQAFIFDSMVLIPNKFCCIIFISLLMWKNCLPLHFNNEQDPFIVKVLSHLIVKKKFYSEQTTGGCDIFQRELINLLSAHFNYSFTLDLSSNLIQHIHKPDFFVSVAMFLKCAHPNDYVEFINVGLFPIIEDYLNTQCSDTNAVKTMELISMITKPFKVSCNSIISLYLTKCKMLADKKKNDKKEHVDSVIYSCYKNMQNKFITYLNDDRTRSQSFEELLVSIIMVLGSVDYVTSCVTLMKWKPNFQPSPIVSRQFYMFKSVLGHITWDKLSAIKDATAVEKMVNNYMYGKKEFCTFERIYVLRWKSK